MRLPVISGVIRRRLLVNFRVDADVMAGYLPAPFRPKLHRGFAIAGICLIRLDEMRPRGLPGWCGISSENAAHRIAVVWDDLDGQTREGVFVPRRDTGSWLNHLVGGRLFPGEHYLAKFDVEDDGARVAISINASDGKMSIRLRGMESEALPLASCFKSLAESSAFFESGCVGYSVTRDGCRLDGIRLEMLGWSVRPFGVEQVETSFFSDATIFPVGSATFDHALIMRDIPHQWHVVPDMVTEQSTSQSAQSIPADLEPVGESA